MLEVNHIEVDRSFEGFRKLAVQLLVPDSNDGFCRVVGCAVGVRVMVDVRVGVRVRVLVRV